MGEAVFKYKPAKHHATMMEYLLDCIYRRENGVCLEPRGAAKTTWGNTDLLTWLISMFPDLRVGLISNTAKQANDFSRAIRWTLESNTEYREIFGENVSPTKWTDVEWLHRQSKWHGSKDVTLYSAGAGGAIISKRFDIILCDDILDEENTATPEAREKVENWFFKTLLPCLVPDGVVICLGTRWAEDDLYQHLMDPIEEGGKGWRSLIVPAETTNADGVLESYWEEHWPIVALQDKRIELGSALYSCAYLNDISGLMEGNVFRKQWFQYFTQLPEGQAYTIRMGIDLASSEKERADYTARAVVAEDQRGNFYVLSVYRDKRETGHASFINDGYMAYPGMGLVNCEAQAFQSTLIQEVMRDYPRIPIAGQKQDNDKVTRARAVAAKYEAHKVWHHESLRDSDFEREQLSFPKGHDDMIDAEGLAMYLGGEDFFFGSVRR
jgi:predicted phage terminase large subunit-like protein